jgi:hypothetical protein
MRRMMNLLCDFLFATLFWNGVNAQMENNSNFKENLLNFEKNKEALYLVVVIS